MRYKPDEISKHEYEVKNVYMEGTSFKAIVFYLRAGEPVDIKIEDVLKKTNIWMEPTASEPRREYRVFFEIRPQGDKGTVDLYISNFTVHLDEDNR